MKTSVQALTVKLGVMGLAVGSLVSIGCRPSPTDPSNANSPEGSACPPATGMIADGNDNNNQVNITDGRGGYWYTFVDDGGDTQVTPEAGARGGTFQMSPGGANGTPFAARMQGTVGTAAEYPGAGMGMNFLDPKGFYDASKYKGISFFAKVGPGHGAGKVRLKVADVNTDPEGGVCSDCYNDFGESLTLSTEWQQFWIPFDRMRQEKGWGKPRKSSIDPTQLSAIQFQVKEAGKPFDVWVDEIQFTGCGG